MVVVARRQRGNALERGRCGLLPLVRQGPRLRVSTSDSYEDPSRVGVSCEDLFFLPCFFAICIDSHPRHPGLTFLADRHARRSPQHRCERQGCVWVREPPTILASWHVLGVIQSDWTYRTATSSRCIAGVRGARQTYRYRTDDLLSYRRRMHMRSAMWRELSCARFLTCRQQ
jgi:hypothetical protein